MTEFNAKQLLSTSAFICSSELPTEIQEVVTAINDREEAQSSCLDDSSGYLTDDKLIKWCCLINNTL